MGTMEDDDGLNHLLKFGDRLRAATSDYDLVRIVKKYTHAKEIARYFAVESAIRHYDGVMRFFNEPGPLQFASLAKTWWTHNFYLYEDDPSLDGDKEFRIIAWDTDGAWKDDTEIKGQTPQHLTETEIPWDSPVCDDPKKCHRCESIGQRKVAISFPLCVIELYGHLPGGCEATT